MMMYIYILQFARVCVCASVCIYIQIYKNEQLRQDFTDSPSFFALSPV